MKETIDKQQILDDLSQAIAEKRAEAVAARKESGIEDVWMACEEAYLGIDDRNRSEWKKAKWAKPTSMEGPVTTNRSASTEVRSSAYVRLTARYVNAGTSRISEILLPVDDKAFSFTATPVPDMITAAPQQAVAPQAPGTVAPVADQTKADEDRAAAAAKKAEQRVYDWMIEARHAGEMRKVIHDSARIGVGVLKAPFPVTRKSISLTKEGDARVLQIKEKTVPGEKWIDPWNLYPGPACGEDIHSDDYILERDKISRRTLRGLRKQPGYLPDAIDRVLKEGPGKCLEGTASPHESDSERAKKGRYEIWYFYGTITADELQAANPDACADAKPRDDVYAIVSMVNDTAIRAIFNPMDSGRFPYYAIPWKRRAGSWAGVGVGEDVSMAQGLCNAATRALINNAGKSAGSQIVIDQTCIVPADGNWTMTPDKVWYKTPESISDDVRKVFMPVVFPNMQAQLMPVIEYAFRLAEYDSNIPLISQGQDGPGSPDTLGQTQIQNNNANALLRDIGYGYDDFLTEPLVHAYYEWLLLDPSVPDDEKGDFQINAHGSIALVEQSIQNATVQEMGQMVLNPAFGVDPKKWFAEWMKSKRMDPRNMMYTEDELAKMAQQPPPEDPRITAAKITAAGRVQVEQLQSQEAKDHAAAEAHIEMARQQLQASEAEKDRQLELIVQQVDQRIEEMKETGAKEIAFDSLKAMLASTSMKLRTQADLALAGHTADLHKHASPQVTTPPTEPPGRAPAGQAFAQ